MREPEAETQAHLDLTLSESLLKALKNRAEAAGLPTAIYVRDLLESVIVS